MNAAELKKAEAKAKRERLELEVLQQIRAMKLAEGMVLEHEFAPPRKWRFDFCWPAIKLALEVEGAVHTGGRHTRGTGFTRDVEKYNAAALDGWLVLRATAVHVKHGDTIRWLLRALGRVTT